MNTVLDPGARCGAPSRANEDLVEGNGQGDFDFRRISRRNPSTINAAITSTIGVIGRVYQSALYVSRDPVFTGSLFLSPAASRDRLRGNFVD
ncbi:Uncharacterized protein DBV15_03984 [Temnothorax longispinosus]|uniref:Uncharacterized protein n=1 Tax=Temnothorax longispinosus TaxID=300112 RepID=A0A4S2L489_9HYME|nr:Uncharacterized protein DBV15_03984 [Temnothorax longispinosus]